MEQKELETILAKVDHAAFATLDTTTFPMPGLRKVTTGTRILLFTNTEGKSVYEEIVKRRLIEAGKDPRNFVLGDLPWGERIPNSPLIVCRGNTYLQTIVLQPGQSRGYIRNGEVNLADFVKPSRTNQGLSKQDEVVVSTYRIDHIDRLTIVGEAMISELPEKLAAIGG